MMQKFLAPFQRATKEGSLKPLVGALIVLVSLSVEVMVLLPGIGTTPERTAMVAGNIAVLAAAAYVIVSLFTRQRQERRDREEEFSEMSRRLELALEVSQIGLWDVDLDSDALRWDARSCQHMGVPFRDDGYFSEADWLDAVHPDDRGRAVEAAESAIEMGGQFISDYRVVWPNGEVRHVRDMATFYQSRVGRPRIVGLVWDVTADKEREAELDLRRSVAESADRAKSSFLAAMSHEIRTPLGGVIGMLDLIESDDLSAEQAERTAIAKASAQNLLRLLNDVLDVTKLEAAAVSLCPIAAEVRPLVEQVTDLMSARAMQKALSLECEIDGGVPQWAIIDPVRLRQVLTNIMSNAISYTDDGFVAVRVRWIGGPEWSGLEVAVSDSGIGIPEEDRARIFERFVQTDASVRRHGGGTGLGLAIARELVELMGGRISVESDPGRGSTFTFTVRADECLPAHAPHDEGRDADLPPESLDILVAEDNATNRLLIGALLRRGGHTITMVGNGREAVEAVQERAFDLVLMDVQMPEMDGLTAAGEIRALDGPTKSIPIVALTASVLADDRTRYMEAGIDACLAKPIDITELNAILYKFAPAPSSQRTTRVA